MKNEKFMRSVGEIGDDLLNEAAGFKPGEASGKKNASARSIIFRRAGLIAAMLAIVITATFLITPLFKGAPAADVSGEESRGGYSDVSDPGEQSEETSAVITRPEEKPGIIFNGGAYESDAGAELPESLRSVEVLANGTGEKLMATSSTLVVKTASECDSETLVQYLTVTPEISMAVTQVSATEFHVKPASSGFAPDTIYRVTVGDPANPAISYAFQTVNELAVKDILPAAGRVDVPFDTGIEITFTDAVKSMDFSEYITVSPAVSGSFMLYPNGKTVAFIPEDNLAKDTVYTVTVKEGVESVSGKTLKAGASSVFRTALYESTNGIYTSFRRDVNGRSRSSASLSEVYAGGEKMTYWFYVHSLKGELLSDAKITARVFRANSWEDARDAVLAIYTRFLDKDFDEEKFTQKYFTKVSEKRVYIDREFTYTPDEDGFYYVAFKAEYNGFESYTYDLFQVSSLCLGGLGCDGASVVCVTDIGGDRIPGATVNGYMFDSAKVNALGKAAIEKIELKCDDKGVAYIENGKNDTLLLLCSDGESSALAFKSTAADDLNDQYVRFIYTDRAVYFTNDKVNVWGVLEGVYGARVPNTLYMKTPFSSVATPVSVDEDGFFSASFEIKDASETYSSYVRLEDEEGRVIAYTTIRVTESEKPVLKAELSFDKDYYLYGETTEVTVKVTFFDGTPARGYAVGLYDNMTHKQKSLVTDEDGLAVFTIKNGSVTAYSTAPEYMGVEAYISGEGVNDFNVYGSYKYFHSKYVLDVRGRDITLNELDVSKCPDYVAGKAAKGKITYTLTKYETKCTEYTEYDTYTKKRRTVKKYNTETTAVKSGTIEFKDGRITLDKIENNDENVYYVYRITFKDDHNSYTYRMSAESDGYRYYYTDDIVRIQDYELKPDKSYYGLNDTIRAEFVNNKDDLDALIVFYANGILKYETGNISELRFTEELLPYVNAAAIYYDPEYRRFGRVSFTALYDIQQNAAAEMDISTDKESYLPGETAVVSIKAPGLANGKALVSIVDEACFALGENDRDITAYLNNLGYYNFNKYYYSYYYGAGLARPNAVFADVSLQMPYYMRGIAQGSGWASPEETQYAEPSDAPNNGGDDEDGFYVRETFLDNPVFATVELDGNGSGTLTFKVPDNLTTWRLTVFGVKNSRTISEVRLAQSVSDTVCTLPFFVKTEICSNYVKGDDIALSVHCFGTKAHGKADYTAVICDETGKEIATKCVSGDVAQFTGINFGKLDEGIYSVTVYAECGGNKDAVKTEFAVVSSMLTANIYKTVTADELNAVSPLAYPVNVVIKGGENDRLYTSVLHRLYNAGRNADPRSDALAAKYAAAEIMLQIYGGDFDFDSARKVFENYISGGAGVCLLPYSEADVELTALVADISETILCERGRYIKTNYASKLQKGTFATETELCATVYALAAMGEPVLDTLYSIASQAGDYPVDAKLYLACGFAAAGDYGAAADIYGALAEEYGVLKDEGNAMYFETGDVESNIKATSLALIAASRAKRADAQKLASYLISVPDRYGESGDLALAAFVKHYLPVGEQKLQKIAYTLADGVRKEAEIGFGRTLYLTLYKADLESLVLENCENADITVRYTGSGADAAELSDESGRIKVQKEIRGEYVTLTIRGTSTRRWEYFEISDVIPSGARILYIENGSSSYGTNCGAYIYNRSGQRMCGSVYVHNYNGRYDTRSIYCAEYSFTVMITYRIRAAVKGEFVVEPALVRSESTGVYAVSDGTKTLVFD